MIFLAATVLCLLPGAALAAGESYVQAQPVAYLAFLTIMLLWGWSICRRVVRQDVRRGLMGLMAILFLWMTLRYAQFALAFQAQFAHNDWKAFAHMQRTVLTASQLLAYLVLALLPSLGLWITLRSEQLEDSARSSWSLVFLAVPFALFALFFHKGTAALAPRFLATEAVLSLLGLGVVLLRLCLRMPRRWKHAIPMVILLSGSLYVWLYFRGSIQWQWLSNFSLTTATLAFLFWEACLRCGVLPANSRYEQFFSFSPVKMQIVDKQGMPVYQSSEMKDDAGTAPKEDWIQFSAEITGGSVLWQDDVSELKRLQAELRQLSDRQTRENRLLSHNNRIRGRLLELQWQNRLCAEVERAMSDKIEQASSILATIPPEVDEHNRAAALKAMAWVNVIACAVKRKSNLFLTGMREKQVPMSDITQALTESARCAASAGLECAAAGCLEGMISAEAGILLYDLFEGILESCLKLALPSLFARLRLNEGVAELVLILDATPASRETLLIPPALHRKVATLSGKCSVTEDEGELHCVCKISSAIV